MLKCFHCEKIIGKDQSFVVVPEGIIDFKEFIMHYGCATEVLCPDHNMPYPCSHKCVKERKKEQLLAAG